MIASFPHRYDVELRWKEGACGTASAPPQPDIVGGPPSQFGAHGYVCRAQGVLEKTREGIVFTGFSLFISLKAEEAVVSAA